MIHETVVTTEGGDTVYTLDKTYAEIASAVAACIEREVEEFGAITHSVSYVDKFNSRTGPDDGTWGFVHFSGDAAGKEYFSTSLDGYPAYTEGK